MKDWLDKHLSVALLIIIQTVGIVWWAATQDARMAAVETTISRMSAENERREQVRTSAMDRLARLETDFLSSKNEVSRRLDRLENKLDQILDRLPSPNPAR